VGRWAELPDTFEQALLAMVETQSDDRRRALLSHLARWPDEARAAAFSMLASRGLVRRIRGAQLMGHLSAFQPDHIPDFERALVRAMDWTTDDELLSVIFLSICAAVQSEGERTPTLGDGEWIWPEPGPRKGPDRILGWELMAGDRIRRVVAAVDRADPDGRKALVGVLDQFVGLDRCVLDALVKLTRDPERDPRDWAIFELAVNLVRRARPEANDPRVLEALWACIDDADCETRNEVALGLAMRRDPLAFEVISRQLRAKEASAFLFQAAQELADPRLISALEAAGRWWPADQAWCLQDALGACRGRDDAGARLGDGANGAGARTESATRAA